MELYCDGGDATCGNGQPRIPAVSSIPEEIESAFDFSSLISQFAQTNFPFKKCASGSVIHTMNAAGSLTNCYMSHRC